MVRCSGVGALACGANFGLDLPKVSIVIMFLMVGSPPFMGHINLVCQKEDLQWRL